MKVSELIIRLQEMDPDLVVTMETFTDYRDGSVVFETPRLVHGVSTFVSGHTLLTYVIIQHGNKISKRKEYP